MHDYSHLVPGGKRVTLRDVADASGLSSATVSYALRGLHVPEETRLRVEEAATRLGYQANPIARALASGRTGQVGVLCRSLEDKWHQDVAAALGRAFLAEDLPAFIIDTGGDPAREPTLASQLADQRVDAIIAIPVDPRATHWTALAQQLVLVSVGDTMPAAQCAAEVLFDNAWVARSAITRLTSAGHQRIAILRGRSTPSPGRPVDLLAEQLAAELDVHIAVHPTSYDIAAAAEVVDELLTGDDPPTAFFALSDTVAYGVYAAARRLGLRVPTDVSVVGLDGNQVSTLLTPPLSGYRWPMDDLVNTVVKRTVCALASTSVVAVGDTADRQVTYAPTVVEGASIAPPPRG